MDLIYSLAHRRVVRVIDRRLIEGRHQIAHLGKLILSQCRSFRGYRSSMRDRGITAKLVSRMASPT